MRCRPLPSSCTAGRCVAVDHAADAVAGERLRHRRRRDIGDGFRGARCLQRAVARLARRPGLLRKRQPCRQGLRKELRTPFRVAGLRTELLVGGVIGAQQVAVADQHRRALQQDHRRIRQQAHARARRVVAAQQEVAVAVDEVHRRAGRIQRRQRLRHHAPALRGIVVADPGLEQVAEDVERLRARGDAAKEAEECLGRVGARIVQMQVGDEERRGHAWIVCPD